VSAAADVGTTTLEKIKAGTKKRIRRSTEQRILEVDVAAASDSAHTDAAVTWKLLNELLARGWSKAELARRLGYKVPALQISKERVLVKNAYKVKRLHAELIGLPPRKKCKCPEPLTVERDDVELCARCELLAP
jgi:lambda repressor-like predicted transcriptional regulator